MNPENKVEVTIDGDDSHRRPKILYSRFESSSIEPTTIKFLIRKHIVKTERQGDILLIVFFALSIAFCAWYFIHSSNIGPGQLTKAEVLQKLVRQ